MYVLGSSHEALAPAAHLLSLLLRRLVASLWWVLIALASAGSAYCGYVVCSPDSALGRSARADRLGGRGAGGQDGGAGPVRIVAPVIPAPARRRRGPARGDPRPGGAVSAGGRAGDVRVPGLGSGHALDERLITRYAVAGVRQLEEYLAVAGTDRPDPEQDTA